MKVLAGMTITKPEYQPIKLADHTHQNSETRKMEARTLSGVDFLRKILLHILPKGFRRARNFGFLHSNSHLVKLVQLIKQVVVPPQPRPAVNCTCCGKPMRIREAAMQSAHPHKPAGPAGAA